MKEKDLQISVFRANKNKFVGFLAVSFKLFVNNLRISSILLLSLIAFLGCSEKSKLGKFYHNTTARFNAHFNAKMKQDDAIKEFEANYKDDYNKIIPVYLAPDANQAKALATVMDEIIKKSSSVIVNHKISKWVDESYFIIGKARFYKGETQDAIEAFQYVYTKFKKETTANEALVWLGKSYIQSGLFMQAQSALDAAIGNKTFPDELKGELFATLAEAKIKQKNYQSAIESLQLAINFTKKKRLKTRYRFVMAQLYQANQQNNNAILAYKTVISSNPIYDMEFVARLNIARLFDGKNTSAAAVRTDLQKMLKDDKNIDFKDLLHFELGRVNLKDNKTNDAIFHFSVAAQLGKPEMKAEAFLQVAQLYFGKAVYESAQKYYDSTATFIAKTHEKYEQVQERKTHLGELVKNLKVISNADSLLQLSTLTDVQLARLVDKQLEKERREQERKDEEATTSKGAMANADFDPTNPNRGNQQSGTPSGTGTFYFYNAAEVGQGRSAFITKFGNRTLEDNWRRSKKEVVVAQSDQTEKENITEKGDPNKQAITSKSDNGKEEKSEKARRIAAVPRTPEEKENMQKSIQIAYYNIGILFRDKLRDPKEAVKYFERLVQQYPNFSQIDEVYFHLSMLFKQLNDANKAAYYERLLLEKHQDSRFAEIIKDPDAAKKKIASSKASEKLYAQTYQAHLNKQYETVLALTDTAKANFATEPIIAKFLYLSALAHGFTNNRPAMIVALEQIVAVYDKDPIYQPAFDMLNRVKGADIIMEAKTTKSDTIPAKFQVNPNIEHVVLLSLDPKNKQNQRFVSDLASFNSVQFSLEKLDNELLALSPDLQLLIVKRFNNQTKAKLYLDRLLDEHGLLAKVSNPTIMLATLNNYAVVVKERSIADYQAFYETHYNQKEEKK